MDLCRIGDKLESRKQERQYFSRNRTGGDAADRFARRSTSAALPVSNSVLRFISKVRVRRPKFLFKIDIVLWPRVFVADKNRDRRAERFAFKNARKNLAAVFLSALRDDLALSRTSTIERALNVLFV